MKVKAKLSRDLRGRYGVECLYRILKIHIYNAYIFMHIYIYICTYIHSCKCEKHKIISNLANKLCAPNETKQNEVRRDNCPACFLPAWWLPAGYARTITELVAGRVGRGQSKKINVFLVGWKWKNISHIFNIISIVSCPKVDFERRVYYNTQNRVQVH